VDLITYTFAPHPLPLSQREKGAGEFPFSLWEKGLGVALSLSKGMRGVQSESLSNLLVLFNPRSLVMPKIYAIGLLDAESSVLKSWSTFCQASVADAGW
jgi:hypothetical protein